MVFCEIPVMAAFPPKPIPILGISFDGSESGEVVVSFDGDWTSL
jgi:hypothetical protein